MSSSIEAKRKARAAFMNALYDASDGSELFYDHWATIGAEVGLSEKESEEVSRYLEREGLAEFATFGTVSITHLGVKEVEASRLAPDTPTEHFAAFNVIYGGIHNSQVQQGTSGSQLVTGEALASGAQTILDLFKQNLDALELAEEERRDTETELSRLEAELASTKPNGRILSATLSTLKEITVSVGGSVAAQAILYQFNVLGVT